jgi:hypothetical protein
MSSSTTSRADLLPAVTKALNELHSYETPTQPHKYTHMHGKVWTRHGAMGGRALWRRPHHPTPQRTRPLPSHPSSAPYRVRKVHGTRVHKGLRRHGITSRRRRVQGRRHTLMFKDGTVGLPKPTAWERGTEGTRGTHKEATQPQPTTPTSHADTPTEPNTNRVEIGRGASRQQGLPSIRGTALDGNRQSNSGVPESNAAAGIFTSNGQEKGNDRPLPTGYRTAHCGCEARVAPVELRQLHNALGGPPNNRQEHEQTWGWRWGVGLGVIDGVEGGGGEWGAR